MATLLLEYDDLCETMWGHCTGCRSVIMEAEASYNFCPYCGEPFLHCETSTTFEEFDLTKEFDEELNEYIYYQKPEGPFLEDYVDYEDMTPEQRQAILNGAD